VRGTDIEYYCVCYEDLGKENMRTIGRLAINCGPEPVVK
jgi:hypothetical protein